MLYLPMARLSIVDCTDSSLLPDVLEASSIAWPNSSMWRQVSLMGPYMAQQLSPRREVDGIDAHSHSPRQEPAARVPFPSAVAPYPPPPGFGSMQPPNPPLFRRQPAFDPFTEPMPPSFTHWRQRSSADVSMPDYATTRGSSSRQVSDPMQGTEATNPVFEHEQNPVYESLIEAMVPKAPTNTPQTGAATPVTAPATANAEASRKSSVSGAAGRISDESLARSLTSALGENLRQANLAKPTLVSEDEIPTMVLKPIAINSIKSRKETMQDSPLGPEPNATVNEHSTRVVSQSFVPANSAGTKRRVVTPAAAKVIDDEDEPRSSPSLRNVSRGSMKQDGKEIESDKRVFSGVSNV